MKDLDLTYADQAVERIGRSPDALIPILQALQKHYGFLPTQALQRVAQITDIRPADLTGVSTFYDMFRHNPAGRHTIRVCHGTACHVTGADRIEQALRLHLRIPDGVDTDSDRQFTIESVACLGCCTLAPVMKMGSDTIGHVTVDKLPRTVQGFLAEQAANGSGQPSTEEKHSHRPGAARIHIGLGSCCMAKGSDRLYHALRENVAAAGADAEVKRVGCVGICHRTPLVEVAVPGQPSSFYAGLRADQAGQLVRRHFRPPNLLNRISRWWSETLDHILVEEAVEPTQACSLNLKEPAVTAFLDQQVHIATEHFGQIDPLNLEEYLSHHGFDALRRCLEENRPERIIDSIDQAGLRGRGGAGFPSARKWRLTREQTDPVKYVVCNGDEGDPGAFMDRMLLESFPYRILEGLAIAAVAVGAHEGFLYIRNEYPLAVARIRAAIAECEKRGWLGDKLLDYPYPLRVSVKEGAGAFVCGEETALIESLEGRRGMPKLRPPFPAQSGLYDHPTLINNVETLAMVPWILQRGPEAFAALGTASSKGTKVFALAGNIRRGGLIEIPMGTTIREIVEDIGGGPLPGRRFKAVQIGGPSGGCVPARLSDTPVDYESLNEVGAIMGSGGLVVLDDTACMVDIARYFLRFTQQQSCGKCTFCRIGTKRMLDILDRLCEGQGQPKDLQNLEQLAHSVSSGSLCGLGRTAPNPVLTTLRYFRHEYEAHLAGRCPARRCHALIHYEVTADCTGCTLCAQTCPVDAIPMTPYQQHTINTTLCTRCDSCRQVCPANAIEVL